MHPTLRSRNLFKVYNARALLSRILSILNSECLQHERSVRGVYELQIMDAILQDVSVTETIVQS